MNIIIDLLLIGILALCVWNGYRKGLILGISGILALVVAFYGANLIAETYSSEFTSMVEPFIAGIVDKKVDETAEDLGQPAENGAPDSSADPEQVYEVSYESLRKIGILKSAAANIADELKNEVDQIGQKLKTAMIHKLAGTLAYVAVLIIIFLLIVIIFAVIANLLNLAFKLPGLELLNEIGGTLFGLVKGLAFIFAISWALRFFGFVIPETTVNKTVLLKWLMNNNPIIAIFGL
ncbi:MAG: CvpA family protein [Clostridiales bacterium]|jgi:uncharacterized membrane protein required for colicin V production|nr:CvpA family protein [Clostridiales bacterium]